MARNDTLLYDITIQYILTHRRHDTICIIIYRDTLCVEMVVI